MWLNHRKFLTLMGKLETVGIVVHLDPKMTAVAAAAKGDEDGDADDD